ncbi:MAG TPA: hypothetical protein VHV83_08765, partial [Armatimonadota bacterium]|nr:hypothetical protein [Armatimonadota bacterium]
QRIRLGLVRCHSAREAREITKIAVDPLEYIIVLGDHDPAKRALARELHALSQLLPTLPFTVKIATANFMGYGLYDEAVIPLDDFLEQYCSRIYAGSTDATEDPVLCITHGDVDGMTCAAQIIRREQGKYRIVYSNALKLASTIIAHATTNTSLKRLYIADIPADEASVEQIISLADRGIAVCWVDHHPWPEGLYQRLERAGVQAIYRQGMQYPAGILLGNHLAASDPFAAQIGKICYASKHGSEWERKWFMRLSRCVGNSSDDILHRLAFDRAFTEDDLRAIEEFRTLEHRALEILQTDPEIRITASNYTLALYDTSQEQGVYLGSAVFDHQKVDCYLQRITQKKWQLAARPGSGPDLHSLQHQSSMGAMPVKVQSDQRVGPYGLGLCTRCRK